LVWVTDVALQTFLQLSFRSDRKLDAGYGLFLFRNEKRDGYWGAT